MGLFSHEVRRRCSRVFETLAVEDGIDESVWVGGGALMAASEEVNLAASGAEVEEEVEVDGCGGNLGYVQHVLISGTTCCSSRTCLGRHDVNVLMKIKELIKNLIIDDFLDLILG